MTGTRARSLPAAALLTVMALAATGIAACSSSKSSSKSLHLVAYSVPKPAYDALTDAFGKTADGKDVGWATSYGPSGTQSKSVANGQRADYVAFSLEPDLTKLVPKFVDTAWNSGPTKGMVSDSVVVIVVRKGNPKHITGWDDLIKPGIKIVTPDPGSSGSAKWNILGAYTHVLANGGTENQAKDYLKKFYGNVVAKPSSGANATTTFLNGTGDALISYENEAIAARQKGQALDYVLPDESFLIENPAAVTKDAPETAKGFLRFVESPDGQKIFAAHGFRPALPGVSPGSVPGANNPADPFPAVKHLTTIADLGGWDAVNKKFFDDGAIVPTIDGSSG